MKDKIIDCNNALLNNSKEDKIIRNYEENFQDIKDLNNLFNLLFTKKSDFDRKQFSLAQKVSYPNLYKLAESGKSLRFIIENDVLKYKTINKVNKIVLPPQVIISTFTSFHIKGIHKNALLREKITNDFYVPTKVLNQCIKKAVATCINCNIFHPTSQRKYIGLKRSLNEHLASNKVFYCDIAYLTVVQKTYYVFLLVDLASSYVITKLFENISVKGVTEYMLTLYGIVGLNEFVVSDSGAENSEMLSKALQQLGIKHKKISPYASNQNSAESNIRVFRHTIKKMITNCIENQLQLDYLTLNKICIISSNIINQTCPYDSQFSRQELYFGLYFNKRGDKINNYISEKTLTEDVKGIILYKDIKKFYEKRLQILNEKSQRLNKKSSPIYLKRGDFVTQKAIKNKSIGNEKDKTYFCVTRIVSPRCHECLSTVDRCQYCVLLPVQNVSLVNLITGHKTQRSVNDIIHIKLSEILNPQFYLSLGELSRNTPDFLAKELYLDQKKEEVPKNYYSLRSQAKQGQILDANFALIKEKNNKYYYKGQLCTVVEKIKMPNINEKEPKKSILVKKEKCFE